MKKVLTIAGSDSGGGAGIQADLKTFCAFGVYGMTAITAVTAQNTQTVNTVLPLSPELVKEQIAMVMEDIGVDAVKTGMLFSSEIIGVVADLMQYYRVQRLVVDPVMVSKSGKLLLQREAMITLQERLLPLAYLVTPNLAEAEVMTGLSLTQVEEMEEACRVLHRRGAANVLLKGGHLPGKDLVDVLFDGTRSILYSGKRIPTHNTHGTGCTYSAALCALFALGYELPEAITTAREYLTTVITYALDLGQGFGPTNHLAPLMIRSGVDPATGGKLW
ncbi:MAG TPA: bifunctional hydroxymethylpyrimidine kinase/phosphomethylpyrimidine kinase [Atribacteraceae bacterium]|nr:bifunctional hydroxymethylpyrimidine kinase/phosphomethylpyrimidine kinase [Atribacteraceae bacterium]